MKKSEEKNLKMKQKNVHYNFIFRIVINMMLFLAFSVLGLIFLINALMFEKPKVINYLEKSNLDYRVYLKENDFYDKEYLDKNMVYVASLIDDIQIMFDYNFNIEKEINLNFNYDIYGKLVISDTNEKNTYYEKVYNLLEKKQVSLVNGNVQKIKEIITISYDEYNKIANKFKTSYGLNTKSNFIIYFNINKSVLEEENELLINDEFSRMIMNIPLSEKSVNIDIEYKEINNESRVVDNTKVYVDNIIYLVIAIILIVIALIYMLKLIRLCKKLVKRQNVYDVYVNKILKEYDRLIVETSTAPNISENNKENIIKINKFTELLDVRDNLKQPIMYYVVSKHQKCYFYINYYEKIYLTTVKLVDLEVIDEK